MPGLSGSRVLIVEDEVLLMMALEAMVREAGCEQLAFAARVEEALATVANWDPDVAILDLNLHGRKSFPVADALDDRGIPFVIVSGHSQDIVPDRHKQRPFVGKPFDSGHLLSQVQQLIEHPVRVRC